VRENPYQTIKRSIAQGIASGQYATGQVLPSEHDLCKLFGVSRMTVNRAMRELAGERLVRRVPGVGSFVAEPVMQSALLEIHNIADEVSARGHAHRAEVFALQDVVPPAAAALAFGLPPDARVFHSAILHYEDALPIQFEDRLVNPAVAPAYLAQDFSATTPNAYLSLVAPLAEVEHVVLATAAPLDVAVHLQIPQGAPCLLVSRRTWSGGQVASIAKLYHPGDRFRLGGRFSPNMKVGVP
jgi:GntR family histidine utilization transcriptional repressor